jgi:Flp pilus assembly protein TadB
VSVLLAAGAAAVAAGSIVRASSPAPRPLRAARPERTLSPAIVRVGCLVATALLAAAGLGLIGVLLGLAATVVVPILVARAEPAAVGRVRRELVAVLPWGISLLAAGLEAGVDPTVCLARVALAVPGVLGDRFGAVAAGLRLGAPVESAWAEALQGGGESLRPLADAYVATSSDGSALVVRLTRLADEALEASAASALAAARRVGVQAVLPLGLCFLPAFVAVGVVPVVVASLTRLHL